MSAASGPSAHRGPYTIADLEAMPEDGQRYELIEEHCSCRGLVRRYISSSPGGCAAGSTRPRRLGWLAGPGGYEQRGVAVGDEELLVTEPFEVRIVPAELIRRRG